MNPNYDLNLLVYLDVLLDEMSISTAASRLKITQPALSNALLRIRKMLDDEIFVRAGRTLYATPFAKRIRLPLKLALAKLDREVLGNKSFDPQKDPFHFNTSFYGYEEAIFFPKLFQKLSRYPLLCLNNQTPQEGKLFKSLSNHEIHFTTMPIKTASVDIKTKHWISDHFVCVAHKNFKRNLLNRNTFYQQNHLLITPQGEGSVLDALLPVTKKKRITPITISEFSEVPFIISEHKNLITSVPSQLAKHWERYFPLKSIPFPFAISPMRIFLSWHKSIEHVPALSWFKDILFACSRPE